jgi:hypothetical protein
MEVKSIKERLVSEVAFLAKRFFLIITGDQSNILLNSKAVTIIASSVMVKVVLGLRISALMYLNLLPENIQTLLLTITNNLIQV